MSAANVPTNPGATLRLVLSYAAFASLWILLSDQAVLWLFRDPEQIAWVSSVKGWFFVAITSVLLYGLVQRFVARIHHSLQQENAALALSAQSHKLLEAIVESTDDAIFAKDREGRYILFNRAAGRIVGKAPADMLGRDDRTAFPPAQAEMLMDIGRQVMALKRTQTLEERLTTAAGERVFLATKGPLRDAQGGVTGIFGISRDITEAKDTEARLQQLNQDLEAKVAERSQELLQLYEHAPCGYHSLDAQGRITQVNRTELALLGFAREDYLGRRLEEFMAPHSVVHWRAQQADFARTGRMRDLELDFVARDGTLLPLLLSADLECDAQGRPLVSRGTLVDHRERQAQTRQILDLNQFLHGVLEVLPFGVVVLDAQARVVLRNQLFGRLLDYPAALLAQEPLHYAALLAHNHARGDYPGRSLEQVQAQFDQLFAARQPSRFERLLAHGVALEIQGLPLAGERTLLTFTDVSQHKAAERSLQEARRVAEAATRAKSEFLANMSHEIRTPMNGMLGLAYLLERASLAPEAARLARKITHTGKSLQGILNDILDFSKIEAGHLALERAPFLLGDVLESVATTMVADPSRAGVELAIVPPERPVAALLGDPLRLGQVLINLVGNAIKFTSAGHVCLAVQHLDPDADGRARLRFSVRDTGIGIAPAQLQEIFKPFSQADASTTRRYGGTGLGLAISRRLLELMGSPLEVRSQPGQGSEFWFTLALEQAPQAAAAPAPESPGLALLVADDCEVARDALLATARSLGWQAQAVDGGNAALRQVLALPAPQARQQVLLLDWQMPDLDGLAVARTLRQALPEGPGPIVVLVTAHSRDALLAEPDSALADAVLGKPVTAASLQDAVASALEHRRGGPAAPAASANQRLRGLRLLVVDDSEINLEISRLIFAGEGAQVTTAANGQEAVEWLLAHPGAVDLVLMDVQMPVMDGMRATRWIRSVPALAGLPVVALSAAVYKTHQQAAFDAGMDEHLSKPMDVERAVALILRLCGRSPAPADPVPGAAAAWAGSPAAAPAGDAPGAPGEPVLDAERGLNLWRAAPVYRQYLRKFARDYAALGADLEQMEPAAQRARCHKLRGAAANLALAPLAHAAGRLEQLLAPDGPGAEGTIGGPASAVAAARQALAQALQAAVRAIADYAGDDAPAPSGEEQQP